MKEVQKMRRTDLTVAGAALFLAALCGGKRISALESETQETEIEGDLFGPFRTQTLDGEEVDQNIFADAKLNMVNIWATYCSPCIREMPGLAELSEEYDGQDLQMIGLISDVAETDSEPAETARLIIEETAADYTHLLLSEDLYYGYLMEVQAVPTTVFVDDEGNQVGEAYIGSRNKEDWEEIIDEMIAETASGEAESETETERS